MKSMQDVKSGEPDPVASETADIEYVAGGGQPAGRIVHDERGNALWKWRGDTSSADTGSGILKHIDPTDLKVEGQGDEFGRTSEKSTKVSDAGGGYDPYNQAGARNTTGAPGKVGRGKKS